MKLTELNLNTNVSRNDFTYVVTNKNHPTSNKITLSNLLKAKIPQIPTPDVSIINNNIEPQLFVSWNGNTKFTDHSPIYQIYRTRSDKKRITGYGLNSLIVDPSAINGLNVERPTQFNIINTSFDRINAKELIYKPLEYFTYKPTNLARRSLLTTDFPVLTNFSSHSNTNSKNFSQLGVKGSGTKRKRSVVLYLCIKILFEGNYIDGNYVKIVLKPQTNTNSHQFTKITARLEL